MKSTIPRFNAQRMLMDYVRKLYWPARQQRRRMEANGAELARQLAAWKKRVRAAWPGVSLDLMLQPPAHLYCDEEIYLRVRADLNGLEAGDVKLECLFGKQRPGGDFEVLQRATLPAVGTQERYTEFEIQLRPEVPGLQHYKLRMYPHNELLSHPLEMGSMIWV